MHFRTICCKTQSLQDHSSHIVPILQDHSSKKQSFQDHSPQNVPILQDHFTTANVCDIIPIKKAFPKPFDQVGNMPGT